MKVDYKGASYDTDVAELVGVVVSAEPAILPPRMYRTKGEHPSFFVYGHHDLRSDYFEPEPPVFGSQNGHIVPLSDADAQFWAELFLDEESLSKHFKWSDGSGKFSERVVLASDVSYMRDDQTCFHCRRKIGAHHKGDCPTNIDDVEVEVVTVLRHKKKLPADWSREEMRNFLNTNQPMQDRIRALGEKMANQYVRSCGAEPEGPYSEDTTVFSIVDEGLAEDYAQMFEKDAENKARMRLFHIDGAPSVNLQLPLEYLAVLSMACEISEQVAKGQNPGLPLSTKNTFLEQLPNLAKVLNGFLQSGHSFDAKHKVEGEHA